MRKTGLLIPAILAVFTQVAAAATITFDDVASGTLINTQYSALGVTFGCFNGTLDPNDLCTGNVYAVSSPSAASPSNVLSLTSGVPLGVFTDERYGYFRANFSTGQTSVSIDARNVNPPEYLGSTTNRPFLQAFNSSGTFLGQALWTGNTDVESWQTLTVSSAAGDIAYVAFSSFSDTGHPVYGMFDNLTFTETTGGGGGGTAVPEPGTIMMLAFGLFGCGVAGRVKAVRPA